MALDTKRRRTSRKNASPLTRRESEIVGLIAQGLSNSAIAEDLGIAIKTVQNHMNSILAKLTPPPWADPRVYLSLWHHGEAERLQKLHSDPGTKSKSRK